MADTPVPTAAELADAICSRHPLPEWFTERELTLGGRRLDVVAFNLWASGGRRFRIHGFEIKVSRGDWLRELADYQKSEVWMQVVDAFYVVTPPKLVQRDELPAGWGLLELCGSRMMTRAHATRRPPLETLPRELAARLIGRMQDSVDLARQRASWEGREEMRKNVERQWKEQHEQEITRLREKGAQYDELARKIGLGPWNRHEHMMHAAALIEQHDGDPLGARNVLDRHRAKVSAYLERIDRALQELASVP